VSFSTQNSVATVARQLDVLSADEIRDFVNTNGSAAQIELLGTANTNWQDEVYQKAFTTDNNISIAA